MSFLPAAINTIVHAELPRLLMHAWGAAKPTVMNKLLDPNGTVARVGECLVWSGPKGQEVIGGLEMLADSQVRIETAVNGIESAQLVTQGMLGAVQSVSIATLGLTSLTGTFMALRLHALNKRIDTLGKAIKDVEGKIDAQHKAHLKSSIQFLREFDDHPNDEGKLRRSLDEARHAANIYGTLAAEEASGPVRLPVLNCRSRFYVVSLLTELRCMMSADDSKQALERIEDESSNLKKVAEACFDNTLKTDPERYLSVAFQSHHVGLEMLTSIYQQARSLGVIEQPQINDANSMFEHVRERFQSGKGWFGWAKRGQNIQGELQKLRYLLACLEESARIAGLKLLIGAVHQQKGSLSELIAKLREWKENLLKSETTGDAPPVYAYAL
jgi:hypothetical protein